MNPKLPGRSSGPSSASPPRCCATVCPPAAAGTAPSPAGRSSPGI